MNNNDVAGVLTTYAKLAQVARDTEHLRDIIRRLRHELDLRKIGMEA